MITNRNLSEGTVLTAKYKKQIYTLMVEHTEDGQQYRLDQLDSVRYFPSLSAAGSYITGGSVNGWRFWSVADETPLNVITDPMTGETYALPSQEELESIAQYDGEPYTAEEARQDAIDFEDLHVAERTDTFSTAPVFDEDSIPTVAEASEALLERYPTSEALLEHFAIEVETLLADPDHNEQATGTIKWAGEARRTTPIIRKSRSQAGLEPTETRYFCAACGEHFVRDLRESPVGPNTCPKGHTARG